MTPTVSCICITQNRRFFLRRSIYYFWRAATQFQHETGDTAELVIVDGSVRSNLQMLQVLRNPWGDRIDQTLNLQYHHIPSAEHSRTGWFHNQACEMSQGVIILQWDDDDWQDTYRITKQWYALKRAKEPSLTYTSKFFWYHLLERKACLSRSWHTGGGTVGSMMAYHRAAWAKAPFRDVPQGEDNFFWDDHQAAKTPMFDSLDPTLCVYVRHNRNGSPLVNASYDAIHTAEARLLLETGDDLEFYDELSELLPLDTWNRPPVSVNPYTHGQGIPWLAKRR
jgi:hypothetical protein